jgi:urease accessory protein UreF
MPSPILSTVNPMAAQMAQLLVGSDLDELREIVKRWVAEAPTEGTRRQYQEFGARLVELKHALAEAPTQPTIEELETALTLMLKLAAESGGKAKP